MTLVAFTNFEIKDITDKQDTAYEFQGTFADNTTTITSVTIKMEYNGEDYTLVIKPKEASQYGRIPDTGEHLSSEIYKDLFHHALNCQGNLLFKDFVKTYIEKYSYTFEVKLIRQPYTTNETVFEALNLYYYTGTHVEPDYEDAIVIDVDTLKRYTVIHYADIKNLNNVTRFYSLDAEIEESDESENEVVTKALIRWLIRNTFQATTVVYSSSQAEWFDDYMYHMSEFKEIDNLDEMSLTAFLK